MDGPTRQLASVECKVCGTCLVVTAIERHVRCEACDRRQLVPEEAVDHLDFRRVVGVDALREVDIAIGEEVEARHGGGEPPRRLILAFALGAAAAGAWAWPATVDAPGTLDHVLGFVGGFFAMLLPLGFTATWMGTMAMGRAERSARARLRDTAVAACPACGKAVQPGEEPGIFPCTGCPAELLASDFFVIEARPTATVRERFRRAAGDALEREPWLTEARVTKADVALLVGVAAAVALCAAAILFFE